MGHTIEPVLFTDPQQQKEKPCPVCGGAVYPPGWHCLRCQREES